MTYAGVIRPLVVDVSKISGAALCGRPAWKLP